MENLRFSIYLKRHKTRIEKLINTLVRVSLVLILFGFIASSILLFRKSSKKEASRKEVVYFAREFLHKRKYYDLGVKLDCSGFVQKAYKKAGMEIPRSSKEQYKFSRITGRLEMGSLIFFSMNGKNIDHVAIYVGDSAIIHSPGLGKAVKIDSLTKPYYQKHLIAIGNILKE